MSSVDKLKTLLNKEGKEYKTYKEFHDDNEKDAWIDEQANEYLERIPPSKVSPKQDKHIYSNRHSYEDALSLKSIDKLKALLNKTEDDEYHNVMNESTKERKGSKYDKDTKTWTNPLGMPTRSHCGATSSVLERLGHGKKVSGQYHGTWNNEPEDHSWVENKHGHIIDASRDQFHGVKEQGIKTIKQDHPDYSKYKKITCPNCGTDKPPKLYTNMISTCTGDNCKHVEDNAGKQFKRHYGREPKNISELNKYRKLVTSVGNKLHGHTKAINKLKALLNKKRNKPRMTYPKIGDNVWDSKQNKWVIEDKQGKGTNILEYKKAIDKLKALLSKEGETNGGEKSQKTENQKKESQEGNTADNYDNREYEEKETPMYPRIIREFPPDKDDKDPYN